MNKDKIQHFKEKLFLDRDNALKLIKQLEDNEAVSSSTEFSSELSSYDNHPADSGDEITLEGVNIAIKNQENNLVSSIDLALSKIQKGEYGICSCCKEPILEERLEFTPQAEYCINCQKYLFDKDKIEYLVDTNKSGTASLGNNEKNYGAGFEIDDSFWEVDSFNSLEDIEEIDNSPESYVEDIEKISNAQYKAQLPD
ncbi:MAG TPA: TraR/DksA C4-type zinc finger protein [Clostridiaceae bacterium]